MADNYVCSMYVLKGDFRESRAPERDGGFALKGTVRKCLRNNFAESLHNKV